MKKKFIRIISGVLTAVLLLIVVLIGYIVVCNINHKVPRVLGYSILRISTGSMIPEYEINSYILTEKVDPGTLQVGDVITFYSSDPQIYMMPNTHRIVEIKSDGERRIFTTKGDNNTIKDSYPVYSNAIVGKVVLKLDFLKVINFVLQNQVLFFLIIIIPIAGIMTYEIIKIVKIRSEKP